MIDVKCQYRFKQKIRKFKNRCIRKMLKYFKKAQILQLEKTILFYL